MDSARMPYFSQEVGESYGAYTLRCNSYKNVEIYSLSPRRNSFSSEESLVGTLKYVSPSPAMLYFSQGLAERHRDNTFDVDHTASAPPYAEVGRISPSPTYVSHKTGKKHSRFSLYSITKLFRSCTNTDKN